MKATEYTDGETYDKIPRSDSDIRLWRKLTKGKDGILELCCGTGRIIMKLLPEHKDITGIDNSTPMLARAKEKTKAFRDNVQFYKRDIMHFNLHRSFDSILLVNNCISHLHTRAEVLRLQGCLKNHMHPGSEFILETATRNSLKHYNFSRTLQPVSSFVDKADGKKVNISEKAAYLSGKKLIKWESYYFKENKPWGKSCVYMRIFDPSEIKKLFTENGFYITKEYGWYNGEPFSAACETYIAVMKKK